MVWPKENKESKMRVISHSYSNSTVGLSWRPGPAQVTLLILAVAPRASTVISSVYRGESGRSETLGNMPQVTQTASSELQVEPGSV